jgi:hypothetical protein
VREDGQRSTFDDYVTFMRTLSIQYMGVDKPTDWNKKGLSDIKNKRDRDECKSADEIRLSSGATDRVYDIVKEMFQKQITHASNCANIISMLFTITLDPRTNKPTMFRLNDDIIKKGFPELERVNREARKILVEYYTSCEAEYQKGMDIVLTEQQAKVDAQARQGQAIQAQATQGQFRQGQARQARKTQKRFIISDEQKQDILTRSAASSAIADAQRAETRARKDRELQAGIAAAQAALAGQKGKKPTVVQQAPQAQALQAPQRQGPAQAPQAQAPQAQAPQVRTAGPRS